MQMNVLYFLLLSTKGFELKRGAPAGVHVKRDWDSWWLDCDREGHAYPPLERVHQIGADFVPAEPGEAPQVVAALELVPDQRQRLERFVQQFAAEHHLPSEIAGLPQAA